MIKQKKNIQGNSSPKLKPKSVASEKRSKEHQIKMGRRNDGLHNLTLHTKEFCDLYFRGILKNHHQTNLRCTSILFVDLWKFVKVSERSHAKSYI